MIRTRLTFTGRGAEEVAKALQPDNLPNMDLKAEGEVMTFEFSTEKLGTLLSTADDLLMNIKVAEETLDSAEEEALDSTGG